MTGLILFLGGLVILVAGSELVVRGATKVATALGISPMIVGLTIVSVGTSAPELAVGIAAGMQGNGAIAVGNIAGTNVLNLLFIMGLSAFLRPLSLHLQIFTLELPVIVVSAVLMMVLGWDGRLSRGDGLLMFAGGIAYTVLLVRVTQWTSRAARREFAHEFAPEPGEGPPAAPSVLIRDVLILLVGIAGTVVGAELLVRGAVQIARIFQISETVIGLTIVAIGTSAPELVTTLVSTIRNERDVAVGNLIGSSIYNILVILGLTCIVTPGGLPVDHDLMRFDVPLMAAVAFGAVPIFLSGKSVSRWEGGAGVLIYFLYIAWILRYRVGP